MTSSETPIDGNTAPASIEKRLLRLENQNRGLRVGLTATSLILCVLVCAASMQPQAADVVKARRFVVVDAEGLERVVLGAAKDVQNKRETTFGLLLRDADGKQRATLVTKDVTGVSNFTLYTGQEIRRLEGWTGKESGGTWVVFDDQGKKMKQLP
jgi:hypothetical protein